MSAHLELQRNATVARGIVPGTVIRWQVVRPSQYAALWRAMADLVPMCRPELGAALEALTTAPLDERSRAEVVAHVMGVLRRRGVGGAANIQQWFDIVRLYAAEAERGDFLLQLVGAGEPETIGSIRVAEWELGEERWWGTITRTGALQTTLGPCESLEQLAHRMVARTCGVTEPA